MAKKKASKTDHPDEMLEFVDRKLWVKLTSPDPKKGLGVDPLAERFRRIFDNARNYCRRGASFARVVQQVNRLQFSSDTDVHVLSEIYDVLRAIDDRDISDTTYTLVVRADRTDIFTIGGGWTRVSPQTNLSTSGNAARQ